MAKIWQDIEIEWDGEVYTVRPSMEFINHLESKDGRSLSKLFIRMMKQDLPSVAACEVIADTLKYAGAEVTAEDVFAETSGGVDATAMGLASTILTACMPAPKDPPQTDNKKKSATRKRTGAKSTESPSTTSE